MTRRAMLAAALAAALVTGAQAGQPIEELLPDTTFMYGGVHRLADGYDKIIGLIAQNLPFTAEEIQGDRMLIMMARMLGLEGVATRAEFLAHTGLDPDGSAGIAWVLVDPSYAPYRRPNENVLLLFPVKDVARTEQLLATRLLPAFAQEAPNVCRGIVSRIDDAKRTWQQANPQAGGAAPTWDDLAKANPGLKPLVCPMGGEYTLGAVKDPAQCSVHGRDGAGAPVAGPFDRQTLGVRTVGGVTFVGGIGKGVGYLLTGSHVVLSNNVLVLDACARAAAGQAPRAKFDVPALADADGRIYVNVTHAMWELRREVDRWRRRRAPQAVERIQMLVDGGGSLAADVRLGPPLELTAGWDPVRNDVTQAVLDTAPTKSQALALVPDTAMAAWGTNLVREVFGVIADITMVEEPGMAPAVKLAQMACDGDGAFAFTRGTFAHEVPNMLFVLRMRDAELAKAAIEMWTSLITREMNEGRLERTEAGGVAITTLKGRREEESVHYAVVGDHVVIATNLPDLKAVIEIQAGRARNTLTASTRYQKLEMPDEPANLLSYMDMPAFVGQIADAEHKRHVFYRNRSCRSNLERIENAVQQFKQELGRMPVSLEELRREGQNKERKQRWYVTEWCHGGRDRFTLTLDPQTGKASCPQHGTLEQFRPMVPEAREPREEEMIFSAFGVWALRLHVEQGRILGKGRLIPSRQTKTQRGHL